MSRKSVIVNGQNVVCVKWQTDVSFELPGTAGKVQHGKCCQWHRVCRRKALLAVGKECFRVALVITAPTNARHFVTNASDIPENEVHSSLTCSSIHKVGQRRNNVN